MTIGLQTNVWTWLMAALATLGWAVTVRLCPEWRQQGWRSVLLSLFGYFWIGFGLNIIVRFLMLSYDCVTLGNMTLRLAVIPAQENTRALLYAISYWFLLCACYAILVRRKGAGPFSTLQSIEPSLGRRTAIPMTMLACIGYFIAENPTTPRVLVTPIGLFSGLWILPATFVWWQYFHTPREIRRPSTVLAFVLLPGIFHAAISPYREHLVAPILIPLLTGIVGGKRIRLRTVAATALVFLLVATVVTRVYRAVKWFGRDLSETMVDVTENVGADPYFSVIGEPLRRFHALDSLLVTMEIVPRAVPFSRRNVFVNSVINGLIPRAIYSGKGEANRGLKFASSIWSYDDPKARLSAGGSIAPSIIGDLYEAGGFIFVALGAVFVGALLGLYEGWKCNLPVHCSVALTILLATQSASAIERDFDFSVATFIQTGLVLVLGTALIALQANRNRARNVEPQLRSVAR